MSIVALTDSIIFEFVQNSRDGYFRNETDWGFKVDAIADFDMSKARWAKAVLIGPDVEDVKIGDYILVDALKWTTAVTYDQVKMWRTIEEHVLATTDVKPNVSM